MSNARRITISHGDVRLGGEWLLPPQPRGVVVFAHGSGSSRWSPRNQRVASALRASEFGTLLFDLLTGDEDLEPGARFDTELLTERLIAATQWVEQQKEAQGLGLGYFGASTGAAAALMAAAALPSRIAAVVSRGGRPDLAASSLPKVRAATLLIVGSDDFEVLELNRQAARRLQCPHRLSIVARATHLFEEPGALEEVQRLAIDWFASYLPIGQTTAKAGSSPGGERT